MTVTMNVFAACLHHWTISSKNHIEFVSFRTASPVPRTEAWPFDQCLIKF